MSNMKILIVDDKQIMRDSVGTTLQRAGYAVVAAPDGETALRMVARHRPAAVISDVKMPEMDGLELLSRLRQADDTLPVVLMTAYGSIDTAVAAMKDGAFDFVQKPFEGEQLIHTVRRAVEHRRLVQENTAVRGGGAGGGSGGGNGSQAQMGPALIGRTPVMKRLAQQIQQIAHSQGTVLVCGESGTGKEVVARTIHAHSPRRDRVMLAVNCAALSSSLLESELFGHEKGAFTGAEQLRKGRFELADGGTLLLDEISEISPTLQAKLLRVLQEQAFERVGSSLTLKVDARVIATTNRELGSCVAAGTFRQDLYYRLNVLPLALPALRERADDIPLLVEHFLIHVALREGREPKRFDDEAIELLKQYTWPGNVRELQNICERASVLTRGQVMTAGTIQPWLMAPPVVGRMAAMAAPGAGAAEADDPSELVGAGVSGFAGGYGGFAGGGHAPHAAAYASGANAIGTRTLEDMEREQIVRTLGRFSGNRKRTAAALGIGVRTLGLKLKKWKEQNLVAQTL
jgi:DNA-binding NtrC family response regulator